jgi:two-component system chemotaxis response regulator CheB
VSRIVAIGTSTGGPQALSHVIGNLPVIPNTIIGIVQHMPPRFTANLAKRLNTHSAWTVVEAADGMELREGTAYVAPGGQQMRLERMQQGGHVLKVVADGLVNGHQPSVDVWFQSVAENWDKQVTGVLMTGMGKDGANGLKLLRDRGAFTIAEAESSCVVYGMPRVAVQLGAAMAVIPLPEISQVIVDGCRS